MSLKFLGVYLPATWTPSESDGKMVPGIEGECYDNIDLSHAGTEPLLQILGSLQHELQLHVGKKGHSSVIRNKRLKSPHQQPCNPEAAMVLAGF